MESAQQILDEKTGPAEWYSLEPKKNDRFVVNFPEEFGISAWTVRSVTSIKYYPKSKKWDPMEIVFYDPIGPSTSQVLHGLMKENKSFIEDFSFSIEMLDPTGKDIEKWTIHVPGVDSVSFGKHDYASSEFKTPSMIVNPISCILLY